MRSAKAVSSLSGSARLRVEALEDRMLLSTLYTNGGKTWVTGLGNGAGGANTSQIEAGGNTFGYNALNTSFHLADDFTVPDGSNWALSSFTIYTYQTGSSTNSTINGVFLRLWDGTNGSPGAGASVIADTSGNLLNPGANRWTGVYRVTDTTLTDTNRPVMNLLADVSGWTQLQDANGGVLAPGHYWIEWGLTGNAALAGPWTPPTIPHQSTDNARQLMVPNTWVNVVDSGGALGQQDLLFDVNGDDLGPSTPAGINPTAIRALDANTGTAGVPTSSTVSLFETGTLPLNTAVVDQVHASAVQGQAAPVATLVQAPAVNNLADSLSQDQLLA